MQAAQAHPEPLWPFIAAVPLGRGHTWLSRQQGRSSAALTADRPGHPDLKPPLPTWQPGSKPRSMGLSAQAPNQGCLQPNGPASTPGPHLSLSATSSQFGWSAIHKRLRDSQEQGRGHQDWLQPEACLLAEPSLCLSFLSGFLPFASFAGRSIWSPSLNISDWAVASVSEFLSRFSMECNGPQFPHLAPPPLNARGWVTPYISLRSLGSLTLSFSKAAPGPQFPQLRMWAGISPAKGWETHALR